MSQNAKILEMLNHGPVTPKDALVKHNIFRLAARIHDLRKMGHQIFVEYSQTKASKHAIYRLEK